MRAFGILLGAFLERSPRLDSDAAYEQLGRVAACCTADAVAARPSFSSAAAQLRAEEEALKAL